MPGKHAELSASGAHIWMNCPASYRLTRGMPDDETPYAEEGTRAHAYCEFLLRESFEKGKPHEVARPDDKEMEICGHEYLDFIEEKFIGDWEDLPEVFIEQRVDFSRWVKGGFGTSDCLIAKADTLVVCDFKYGKGVRVEAEGNPQLRLYALGAVEGLSLWDFNQVEMNIIQPRLDHVSTETIGIAELLAFGDEARKASELAFSGEGRAKAGPWCKFCKANPICKERAKRPLETMKKILNIDKGGQKR